MVNYIIEYLNKCNVRKLDLQYYKYSVIKFLIYIYEQYDIIF